MTWYVIAYNKEEDVIDTVVNYDSEDDVLFKSTQFAKQNNKKFIMIQNLSNRRTITLPVI